MRVLLLTRYGPLGASSRLRAYQYLPYLQSQGFRITATPLLGDYYQEDLYSGHSPRWGRIAGAYLSRLLQLARAQTFDLLWIEYELFPWLPAVVERLLASLHIPYVVDYDDAIYHRYELHPSPIVRRVLCHKIDAIMRGANSIVVGNRYLAERARAAGARRIGLLPTAVNLDRYTTSATRNNPVFTVGWIGSPSTVKYLSLVEQPLAAFFRDHKARLVVVGPRDAPLGGMPLEVRPWSADTEVDDIR